MIVDLDNPARRRGILKSLSTAGAVFLAACTQTDEQLISKESQRLPITPSQREAEFTLWRNGSMPNTPPFPMLEETFSAAQAATEVRMRTTLNLMPHSNNPRFREAIHFYDSFNPNDIPFGINGFIYYRGKELPHRVDPQVEDGVIRWYILLSADHFVNRADSVIQALTLITAMEEISQTKRFIDRLPPSFTSPAQQLQAWKEYASKTENRITLNASVLAKEAEAYIYAYGLGHQRAVRTIYGQNAAAFIRGGKSVTSPRWREFIQREQSL